MSIKVADAEAGAVAQAPRISLKDIEDAVAARYVFNGGQIADAVGGSVSEALNSLTIAIVVLKNGFTVVGTSAPASAENYDQALGEKFAYEHALRQIWPFMGFALRERLHAEAGNLPEES